MVVAPQTALVLNAGFATASSGDNVATGNASQTDSTVTQTTTTNAGTAEVSATGGEGGAGTAIGVAGNDHRRGRRCR